MTFSVRYQTENPDDIGEHAVDWDWNVKGHWAMSDKEGGKWYTTRGLDEEAYLVLLRHFGLENYRSEFPLEKIMITSPDELGKARKEKERLEKLVHKEIANDTIGEHAFSD